MMRLILSRLWMMIAVLALPIFVSQPTFGQTPAASASDTPSDPYRISGVVVSKTDGNPLARARITATDTNNPRRFQSQITTEDGKFDFRDLPAGKYSLQGAKRGYISAAYDQHEQFSTAIVTGAGLSTDNLTLKLAPHAVIWGRIFDEAGEPVRHGTVTLYSDSHTGGTDEIRRFRMAQTDDLGAYEITSITPGTYFLSARATPWYAVHPRSEPPDSLGSTANLIEADRSLDVAYPTIYYADTTETDSATPIPLAGGERVEVDFHFNPVPALHLLFRVPGDRKAGFPFVRLEQPEFDNPGFVNGVTRSVSPGLVEIDGIPAGRYNVSVGFPGEERTGVQMDAVELTKDGQEIDTSTAAPLSTVKLSVQLAGQDALSSKLSVGLRSKGRTLLGMQKLDSKDQAEIKEVPAGRYEIVVLGSTKRYSIAHISAQAAELTGHTITVAAGTSPSVSLTLNEGSIEVRGIAKRAGKGFAGAMVVLVPKESEGNGDLFRRDQADLDGTFTLRDVVPGDYILLSIDNGWDLEWSKPAVISAYIKYGRTVNITSHSTQSVIITEPIEVRPR